MDIAECYRALELTSTANLEDLKTSYRRLARQWHPDVNPGNEEAHEQFIRVTQAYKALLKILPAKHPLEQKSVPTAAAKASPAPRSTTRPAARPTTATTAYRTTPRPPVPSATSPKTASQVTSSNPAWQPRVAVVEPVSPPSTTAQPPPRAVSPTSAQPTESDAYQLKYQAYQQLQTLIKTKRFPRAIALIEALNQRLPQDPEVRQWQAIIYQRWGRQLIAERKFNQARAYLNKALQTDPNNKSLCVEIERDFQVIKNAI
jgi:tetratricopeptide (TPR) repeat protein